MALRAGAPRGAGRVPGTAGAVPDPGALPPGLDPTLPALASALDPAAVAARFERRWPGPGRAPSISRCVLERAEWVPGVDCVATYLLTPDSRGGEAAPTIGVVSVEPDGVRHRLFAHDAELPGLGAATDPDAVGAWLGERLERRVGSCSVTAVRYRPGRRCTLRYELPDDHTVVYAKVLPGDLAARLASTVASLGEGLVAPLLGVAPQWQLVAQADAGSRSLRSVVSDGGPESTRAAMRAAGRLLADLHARTEPAGPHRALADDARTLERYLPAAERVSPAAAALLADGIDRIARIDAGAGEHRPGVASHGAFRLDQVHLTDRGPVLIDLDTYCSAEAARDVGNLLAYLRWRVVRGAAGPAVIDEIAGAFLDGYATATGTALDAERVRLFEAASLLKIAGRRYRGLAVSEWPRVPDLLAAALDRLGTPRRRR